jgi:Zn finger protein HypA/HybF involved in hydrogenase expression
MKKFFNNLGIKLQQFMYGRYGFDQLYRFLTWLYLILLLILAIIGRHINQKLYLALLVIPLIILIYAIFRAMSKNIVKRRIENNKYLSITNKIKANFKFISNKWKFRKTHVLKKCPNCKSVLRLKRKKGKYAVVCPHCKTKFEVKIKFNAKE